MSDSSEKRLQGVGTVGILEGWDFGGFTERRVQK